MVPIEGKQVFSKSYEPLVAVLSSDEEKESSRRARCSRQMVRKQTTDFSRYKRFTNRMGIDCDERAFVIDPVKSRFFHLWDVMMSILLVLTAFVTPYESAFLESHLSLLFLVDKFGDLLWFIGMGLQFFLAYPDPKHPSKFIKAWPKIVSNYFTKWFPIDALSLIPVDSYCIWVRSGNDDVLNIVTDSELFRILRLVRLLRLCRFLAIFDRWSVYFGFSYAVLTLLKFFTCLVAICHWTACLWGGLALYSKRNGEINWLSALEEAKGGPENLYTDHFRVYFLALYWAIITVTSIGYGDITPQSGREYLVASFCTTYMAAAWAYVIGSVCTIVSTLQPHEIFFKRTMDDLNWVMADREMPAELCTTLRAYFHEAREMHKQSVEEAVISQMSPMLQGEFSMFLNKTWLQKVWYLRDMNRDILIWTARHLALMIYAPTEEILQERTLFIVRHGMVARRGRILSSGDIWGEDMLLSNDQLRDNNIPKALGYLSVLRLHIADLFDIVVSYPEAKARLRWAQVRIATIRGMIMLAKHIKALQADNSFRVNQLEESLRDRLYKTILSGALTPEASDLFKQIGRQSLSSESLLAVTTLPTIPTPQISQKFPSGQTETRSAALVLDQLCMATTKRNVDSETGSMAMIMNVLSKLKEDVERIDNNLQQIVPNPTIDKATGNRRDAMRKNDTHVDFGYLPSQSIRMSFHRTGTIRRSSLDR